MECSHCKAEIPEAVRYCPYCGRQVGRKSPSRFLWWGLIGLLPVLAFCAFVVFILFRELYSQDGIAESVATTLTNDASLPATILTPADINPTVTTHPTSSPIRTGVPPTVTPVSPSPTFLPPLPTFPPPLAVVPFPELGLPYPIDWPAYFRLPESFELVEFESGQLPDGGTQGLGAKFRYEGTPEAILEELEAYLPSTGWEIIDKIELDSGGLLLFVSSADKEGEGMMVIDPDPVLSHTSRIMLLLAP